MILWANSDVDCFSDTRGVSLWLLNTQYLMPSARPIKILLHDYRLGVANNFLKRFERSGAHCVNGFQFGEESLMSNLSLPNS